ncbi:MAG: acyl carrier protein phosphodiesterase [Flavobacteriaceae bacterium]|nr:acyl carrier protein phosphodiesterase [Flavobacteriaceae bacterium]
MNLVLHQLLSFRNPQWQIGNHLGEVIKGKQFLQFEPQIQKGILLHRFIDTFSDSHASVKSSSAHLHFNHSKFSPIIIDVYYDFLLIKNWESFTQQSFTEFKLECYRLLLENMDLFPEKLQRFTHAMVEYDWFESYGNYEGLEKILSNMSRRTKFQNNMHWAVKDLYLNEAKFELDFMLFFPELIEKVCMFLEIPGDSLV